MGMEKAAEVSAAFTRCSLSLFIGAWAAAAEVREAAARAVSEDAEAAGDAGAAAVYGTSASGGRAGIKSCGA